MTDRPSVGYALLASPAPSAFSRPRREKADDRSEIHLVKSQDPAKTPADPEAWFPC